MKTEKIENTLSGLLPERTELLTSAQTREAAVKEEALKIKAKQDAKEVARLKYREQQRLRNLKAKQEKNEALAKELGLESIPDGRTEHQARAIAEQEEKVKVLQAIEDQVSDPLHPVALAEMGPARTYSSTVTRALQAQGTTRPEVMKLLTSLNINLSLQLSKQDTANLLACLLTCNESQLISLQNNKKVPVVIKTVIKRLLEDMKLGNIDTIETLWDRVFGKGPMQLNLPEQQTQTGIIPNVPISREAYVIIRDTLMK